LIDPVPSAARDPEATRFFRQAARPLPTPNEGPVKIVRIDSSSGAKLGILNASGDVHAAIGTLETELTPGERLGNVADLRLLAPCEPTKIFCVGQNYRSAMLARGRELPSEPVVFLKTPNSVIGPGAEIVRPDGIERFAYEGELAVVIGKTARNVVADQAFDYILGYACGNDVTVRDWQEQERHWVRSKTSDTFCPLGPWIETDLDPSDLSLKVSVNGELHQDGRTSDLIFSIPFLIEHLSRWITLVPGDVILTGTPLGAQPVVDGDLIEIEIEGIGTLRNRVIQAPARS
jgi:2-keto-4-pentenoate hydratase/2-oxohepta-3-ene-1,7-dioic acid hydratase in catechol pathway